MAILCSTLLATGRPAQTAAAKAAERQTQQRLQQRVTIVWQGQPLATALRRLAETQHLAFWLDRRVDPQQTVEARFANLSLRQVLEQLANKYALRVSVLGSVIYVGPKSAAPELTTLARQARASLAKAPAEAKRRWFTPQVTDWPRLSTPRALLGKVLDQAEIKLLGSEQIVHDLWDAKQLPPLAPVDAALLILVGFDLTCQISSDGRSCRVVPIKRPLTIAQKKRPAPKLPRKSPPSPDQTKRLFSLQLKNQPVGNVIDQLAKQLELQVIWENESKQIRTTLVSCDVLEATLEELLKSILTPAGLQFRQEETTIKIEVSP